MTTTSDRDNNAGHDLAGYLRTEAPGADGRRGDGGAPPEDDDTMRDMEKSLVERIADVDDDRRRTAIQLQKAFNTHRDETAASIRRGLRGIAALVAVVSLLLAGAVGWDLWRSARVRAQQAEAMAALGHRVDALAAAVGKTATEPAGAAVSPAALSALGGRVDQLASRVAALSSAVAEQQQRADGSPAGATAADIDAALRPLRNEQKDFAAALEELRGAVDTLPARARAIAEASAAEAARSAAAETPRAAAAATPALGKTMSTAELDRLIDQQLARLEREYQRLAMEVQSPAVRQAASPEPDADTAGSADTGGNAPSAPPASANAGSDGAGSDGAGTQDTAANARETITVGERRYAVQLIGFYSRGELNAFIAANPLPPQVYTREETFRGQPWFVLIHSLHQDLAGATETQRELPPALAGLDIWIRNLPADTRLEVIDTSGD